MFDRQEDELSFIPEPSKEDELELNISGLENLSNESYSAPLIHTKNFNFNEQAAEALASLTNQEIVVISGHYLFSRFDEPIQLELEEQEYDQAVIDSMVFSGDTYELWGQIPNANLLIYFQRIEYPIFFNPNALLFVQLNDAGEMVQYVQTRLDEPEEAEENQALIQQYDAVYRLYHNSNALDTNDEVTDVILGYHNLVSLANDEQLLNPTWNIQVNDRRNHFVNAIEGHTYPRNRGFTSNLLNEAIKLLTEADETNTVEYNVEEDIDDLLRIMTHSLTSVYENLIEESSE